MTTSKKEPGSNTKSCKTLKGCHSFFKNMEPMTDQQAGILEMYRFGDPQQNIDGINQWQNRMRNYNNGPGTDRTNSHSSGGGNTGDGKAEGSSQHNTWMPIDDIMKCADRSEAFNPRDKSKKPSGPWITDFQEMCVKTVIKRARKQWPGGNKRLDQAIRLSNVAENYIAPDEKDIEGTAVELVEKDQATMLRTLCKRAHMRVARVYEKFECRVMEELPLDKFKECHDLLLQAVAHYDVKNAEKEDVLFASDYGLTFRELEDIGATYETEASIRTNRDD